MNPLLPRLHRQHCHPRGVIGEALPPPPPLVDTQVASPRLSQRDAPPLSGEHPLDDPHRQDRFRIQDCDFDFRCRFVLEKVGQGLGVGELANDFHFHYFSLVCESNSLILLLQRKISFALLLEKKAGVLLSFSSVTAVVVLFNCQSLLIIFHSLFFQIS